MMKKRKIGAVTVGQSPRTDITTDADTFFHGQVEILESGALDSYSLEEVQSLSRPEGDYLLTSRMRDGAEVHVARSHILLNLQKCISHLEYLGAELILMFCTGELGSFWSSIPLLEPGVLLRQTVPLACSSRHIITLTPSPAQADQSERRWRSWLPEFTFTSLPVSPYAVPPDFSEAIKTISRSSDTGLVIRDCLGFSMQMKKELEKQCTKKILLPREVLFSKAADLLEISK